MVMNLIIPAAQIYGGIVSGSMALISDALHNLSDLTSIAVSYAALRFGERGPTPSQTFGYKRVEVFAALLNVALLYAVAVFIAVESWQRLLHPQPIEGTIVIWISLIAFLANIASSAILQAAAKDNINMRSAFLHMLTDAFMSLGVALMGIIWIFRPWYWLDPVLSWLIVVMILYSGWGILKETVLILMNATPPGIDIANIQREIESIEGVQCVHHLHVWNTSPESISLAAHVLVPDQRISEANELAERIRSVLLDRFRIDHPILQFEAQSCGETGLLCCALPGKDKDSENHHH